MRGVIVAMAVLVPSMGAGQDAGRPAKEDFEAVAAQYKAAMDGWAKLFDSAGQINSPEAAKEARYLGWPGWAFAPRFVELAEVHPGETSAFDALSRVLELGLAVSENDLQLAPHYRRAVALLIRDHLDDARLKEVCRNVAKRQSPAAETLLRAAAEQSRNRDVRGAACLGLAQYLAAKAEMAEKPWFENREKVKDPFAKFIVARFDPAYFLYLRGTDPREANAESAKLFEQALKDYADVIYWQDPARPAFRRTVGEIARAALNQRRPADGKVTPKAGEAAEKAKSSPQ
jgi:hypothetical protein